MHLFRPRSLVSLFVAPAIFVSALTLGSPSLEASPEEWTFANVLSTNLSPLKPFVLTPDGSVLAHAVVNSKEGLYRYIGETPAPVIQIGTDLPNKLGHVDQIGDFHADAQERIVFTATVRLPGPPLGPPTVTETHCYRWERDTGTITLMLPSDPTLVHLPNTMISDGRWLVETDTGPSTARTRTFQLTDGVTATAVASFTESDTAAFRDKYGKPFANTSGNLVITRSYTNDPFNNEQITSLTTEILLFTPVKIEPAILIDDVFSINRTNSPERAFGAKVEAVAFNDNGTFLYEKQIFAGGSEYDWTETLFVQGPTGSKEVGLVVVKDDNAELAGESLDPEGRIAFGRYDGNLNTTEIIAGPSAGDLVVRNGSAILSQAATNVSLISVSSPPGTFGDRRTLLIRYGVSGAIKYAVATKDITRWINPAGGDWLTNNNWNPASVPVVTTSTLFNLDATYDVNVGTQAVARVAIEKGSVRFASPTLTLTGLFSLGLDATFTQSEGTITAADLTIGSLPPLTPTPIPVAHFNLSNKDTTFTTSGPTTIGNAGEGDLYISDAKMISSEVRIGAGSKGSATVSLENAEWRMESLAVGYSHEATLTIDRGGFVRSGSSVIGLGDEIKNDRAIVAIDNAGASATKNTLGNWLIANDLTVGSKLPGRLSLTNGATAAANGTTQTALETHDGLDDAQIRVTGTLGRSDRPSQLFFFADAFLGMKAKTFTRITIDDGAQLIVSASLSAAHEAGSRAKISVRGVNANGARSTLDQTTGTNDLFALGQGGVGVLHVLDGAIVKCVALYAGNEASSDGEVYLDGQNGLFPSALEASYAVVVGGNDRVSTSYDASGLFTVQNGARVETGTFFVSPLGRVRGNGTIVAGQSYTMNGGVIEPGVGFLPLLEPLSDEESSPLQRRSSLRSAQTAQAQVLPGTLTIVGNAELSPTTIVELDVSGGAPGAADRLVVNGSLALAGTLALHFTDGYAPKAGDTLDLISATSTTGAFSTVTIAGLAPEFQYTLTATGDGGLRLTALNDGVPTTETLSRLVNLSVRTPLASEQNLIVGFVVQGGAKPLLVRAAGPGLGQFIDGTHPDPRIILFNEAKVLVDTNDNWSAELATTFANVGAFPFLASSTDAALLRETDAPYTAHVNGPGSGIVLVEVYDAGTSVSPRLINLSARNHVGVGADVLIAGFVITGSGSKTLLVRGVGPSLSGFGVTGVLTDPLLTLFDDAGKQVAQNDDWPASLSPTFASVGAFPLETGTKDAALVVTLAPGSYTAQLSGVAASTGEALVEVYEAR